MTLKNIFKSMVNKKVIIIAVLFLIFLFYSFEHIINTYWMLRFIREPSSEQIHLQIQNSGIKSSKKLAFLIKNTNPVASSKYWSEVRGNAAILLAEIDNTKAKVILLKALHYDKNETVLKYYIPAFAYIGETSIPKLIENTTANSVKTRENSIVILSNFKKETALKAILRAIGEDKAWEVREAAAKALANYKDRRSVKALMKAIYDDNGSVSETAFYSLIILKDDLARKEIYKYYNNYWSVYSNSVNEFKAFRFCFEHGSENMKNDALNWLAKHNLTREDTIEMKKKRTLSPDKIFF